MKRKNIIIVLCVLSLFGIFVLVQYVRAYYDYKSCMELPPPEECNVSIKRFSGVGEWIDSLSLNDIKRVNDSIRKNLSFEGIQVIDYAPVIPEYNAYSIHIWSKNYHHIFMVANAKGFNYIYGTSFQIKVANGPVLVDLLDSLFAD